MKFHYIRDFYNAIGQHEELKLTAAYTDRKRGESTRRMLKRVFPEVNGLDSVLEIGPASGFITEYVVQELSSLGSTNLDVMDLSHAYLEVVRSKGFPIRNYIEGDLLDEETVDEYRECYQMILFQEVVEHLVSPFEALCNLNSMLAQDGFLYLSLPNAYYWRYQMKAAFRSGKLIRNQKLLDSHISELAPLGAIRLASMTGFNLLGIDYYASRIPVVPAWTSPQLGILLQKQCAPVDRWTELTGKILGYWKATRAKGNKPGSAGPT